MLQKLKNVKWGYLLFALLFFAVGICFLIFNDKELLSRAVLVIGILLSVFAGIYAVLTLANRPRGGVFFFRMLFAVLGIICGIVTAVFREGGVETVVTVIGLLLIIDGSFKLQTTILARRHRTPFWWFMMVCSALIIGSGFVIVKFFSSMYAGHDSLLCILLGLSLILDGVGNLLSLFFIPAYEARMRAEHAEAANTQESAKDTAESGNAKK